MAEPSQATQALWRQYQLWHQSLRPKEGVLCVHVDEVASAVASFYEKIRGVVDWKEEHLLRRAALERILKRRLFLQNNIGEVAEPLVLELIRSGHFPNDSIEETIIGQVGKTLHKYSFILQKAPEEADKLKIRISEWLMKIAACEIEEILSPSVREKALIEYMTELMTDKIQAPGITETDKKTQVFIACQKALFKLDEPIITFHLLQKKYTNWLHLKEPELTAVSLNIYSIWRDIEKEFKHPLAEKFYQVCEKYDTAYLILGDVLSENPDEKKILFNPKDLESSIRKFYGLRLQTLKLRIARAAVFSTISIFLTKILVALAVEIPLEKYFWGHLNYQALGLNILIPPLLMFFLVLTIKPAKKENLDRVIMEVMKIVYEKNKKDVYIIKPPKKKGVILTSVIAGFYLLTFILSFGAIIWGLKKLNFGIISMAIFLIFFSLIAFAGLKIRDRAKELEIAEEKGGFLSFLVDSFSLPFLRAGKWLSHQWSRYNVVVVFITAFIDMPFQLFTEFLEHWRTFLKEKKEEIH